MQGSPETVGGTVTTWPPACKPIGALRTKLEAARAHLTAVDVVAASWPVVATAGTASQAAVACRT